MLLFVSFYQLEAQSFSGKIEPYPSSALEEVLSASQVFRFDAKLLDAAVKNNLSAPLEFKVGDKQWRLVLEHSPIVSENYLLQVQTPQGIEVSYPKRNIAFRGYELNGGGKVRLTINGEFLYGYVDEPGGRYYIEPLWYYEPMASRDLFVLYEKSAAKQLGPDACGVTEEELALHHYEEEAREKIAAGADNQACYELELAIASDHFMFNSYGSVDAVENHNIGVINDVQGDYTGNFNHDLVFVIVTQFVSTSAPGPWSPSNDAGTLLGSFRTWGNNGNFGVGFDIGELWTDRDFNGGTVGIAYLNGVCNSFKYHCLQDFTGNGELLRCMTSHEIGHNFSSGHDGNCPPGDFIMCPFVSNSTVWSNQSQNAINAYMQNRINDGCLAACGPPPVPLDADFTWMPDPGCQGQQVEFTDQSSGVITSWSWQFPGGTPATSIQQNPVVTWNTPGIKNVTLTINGVGGSSTITKPITITPLPVANFTYTVNGLELTFTNTSSNATSYEWDFGDGFQAFEENPVHTYTDPGFYIVTLIAFNECGSSTKTFTINTAPIADFSASPTSGCAALVVQMMNESSSNAVTYTWSFPGGAPSSSNQANPTVIYAFAGVYTITLTATNSSGSHTFTRTQYITVNTTPTPNFTHTVNGATVTFTNTSSPNSVSYLWNFGDGNTSTETNPVHTYADPGTYTVVLTATNDCGSISVTRFVTIISSGPPVPAFTANPSTGCAPLTVNFNNNSTGANSYSWDFPGGNPSTSTAANPTVVYNNPGVYTVTLTAGNANGTATATATITVNTIPTSGFTYSVSNDTTVAFTNTSTGATSYLWTFGDGDSSTVANPVHNYPALDTNITYTVILLSINDCGTVRDTQTITIINNPNANFTATPTSGCGPLTVQFNNSSSPNAGSFIWDFPGGSPDSSNLANPVVVYNTPGTYSVTLIAINTSGQDTFTRVNYIVVNTTPTAGFTHVTNGLTVNFINASTGATSYSWDFGDGNGSTDASPSHTYATDGTYTVVLSVTNACGTVTTTQSVTVATAPTAGFTVNPNIGCAPLTVQFTNTSSANAVNYDWQFPGGTPSSSDQQTPPDVTYNVAGTYTASLTVSNAAGSNTFTQTIIVNAGPTANFSSTVAGLTATFDNNSSNALSYSWDFGDGNSSSDANPTHTYGADGTYTVILTASNLCGSSTFTQTVVITTEPSAGFSASTTSGCAPLTVQFTDISAGAPVSWSWEFPGGTPSSSTAQNPTVIYFVSGVYDVTLVVTSAGGSTSSFTQPNLISVQGAPGAGFSYNTSGSEVSFINSSVDATSYVWNFGDGSTSTEENPTHTYAEDGVYNVSLAATNNCGTTIFEQSVTVATPPTAGFNLSASTGCTPFTVQFTNTSSSNATSYLWDFPGGTPSSSTDENPTVTWNTAGVYVVTLTATNGAGSSSSTATVTVNPTATAGFTYVLGGLTAVFTNTSINGDTYVWDFGDGSNLSNETNPSHTYAQTGNYTVTLSVTNSCGTVTITQQVSIKGSAPVPAIDSDSESGCLPYAVQFTDLSAGDPVAWNWTFEGGTPATSTNQNPLVNYTTPGTYDVTLEVTNAFGTSTQVFADYITVQTAPSAGFNFAAFQTTVTFTNTSQNATSYAWNFGDGNTSNEANPTHTYGAPGTYNVSLAATNNCGTTIFEQTVTLSSGTGEAAWLEGFRLFPNPNTGLFTVEMNGLPQNEVEFVLYNALGQQIKRDVSDFGTGALVIAFDYRPLAAGVYTLRVQADGQAMFVKVVIQ
ncbi:MAG: PKD domain-containing protein [Saprospiraceae bacterium]|nr:PKD domain-containing protein [Saprospiraceae bacterium]